MTSANQQSMGRPRQLLAGWLALFIYAGIASPLGAGIIAAFGTIDPDHQAFLQTSSEGTRLVLHHQQKGSGHEHHAIARVLTFLAQPVGKTDPDHVVQLAGADGCWRDKQQAFACCADSGETHIAKVTCTEKTYSATNPPRHSLPPPRPPPDLTVNLLCLSSTVLLI